MDGSVKCERPFMRSFNRFYTYNSQYFTRAFPVRFEVIDDVVALHLNLRVNVRREYLHD